MSGISLRKQVEDLAPMSAEELKTSLPLLFEEVKRRGVEETLKEVPGFLSKIIAKFLQIDGARYLSEQPGVSARFMDIFWEGVGSQAHSSEELRSALERTKRKIHVNVEASDSPLNGHFIVSKGMLEGGSGMLHFKDEDYRFMGPTEVLLQLLTGELSLGLSNLSLQTAGHSGFAGLVAPVIRAIASAVRGPRG